MGNDGVEWEDPGCIHTVDEAIEYINNIGFLPLFKNEMERIEEAKKYQQIKDTVDDYMNYYNNERYVWDLAYLSPNEYYKFVMTGKYAGGDSL